MRYGIPLGIQDIAPHLPLLAPEVLNKVLFREALIPWSHYLVLQEAIDAVSKDGRAKVSLRRFIECHLTQVCTCVGVGGYQYVGIWIEENAERQVTLVQQYLRRGFVLSVEKSDLSAFQFGRIEPGQWNVQLGTLTVKFLNEPPD